MKKYICVCLLLSFILMGSCNKVNNKSAVITPTPITTTQAPTPKINDTIDEKVTPTKAPLPEKKETSLTLSVVGDIMCHSDNLKGAFDASTSQYDFKSYFEYVKPYIEQADIAICNFETVTAGEQSGYTSFPLFNTPDALIEALNYTGFDILSTANNHCLDRGKEGLLRTHDTIKKNGMIPIGTNTEKDVGITLVEKNDIKVAFLAYTYSCNGNIKKLNENERYMVNLIDEIRIEEDIKEANNLNADIIIVIIHWGNEYRIEQNEHQENLASKIFEMGADVILGSHPHVIQPFDITTYDQTTNKYIIYSMGNFLSNYRITDRAERPNKPYTEDGIIVNLQFSKLGDEKPILNSYNHIPTWIDKYYEQNTPNFRIIPLPDGINNNLVTSPNIEQAELSYKRTIELLTQPDDSVVLSSSYE